jgi:hypothetical protein
MFTKTPAGQAKNSSTPCSAWALTPSKQPLTQRVNRPREQQLKPHNFANQRISFLKPP